MSVDNRPRVLLADDERDIALVARMRLEVNGYDVATAADGAEALERFESFRPDLVLLDLRMPKLDGYQVCRALKSNPATRSVPVIIFSASSSQALALERKCLELGADDFVRKPYSSEDLLAKVRRHLPAGARVPAGSCPRPSGASS
ncbi:response regulator [candidate division WOR-3 bacterium]|nr:response regulator [candidate division WOR-3 bacterium]